MTFLLIGFFISRLTTQATIATQMRPSLLFSRSFPKPRSLLQDFALFFDFAVLQPYANRPLRLSTSSS